VRFACDRDCHHRYAIPAGSGLKPDESDGIGVIRHPEVVPRNGIPPMRQVKHASPHHARYSVAEKESLASCNSGNIAITSPDCNAPDIKSYGWFF
jgi:hypothetical protein